MHRFVAGRNANTRVRLYPVASATWNDFVFSRPSSVGTRYVIHVGEMYRRRRGAAAFESSSDSPLPPPRCRNQKFPIKSFSSRAEQFHDIGVHGAILRFLVPRPSIFAHAWIEATPPPPPRDANRFSRVSIYGSMGIL